MNTKRSRAGLANSILIAASLLMASSSRLLPATRNPQEANQAATQTSKSQASNPLVQMLKSPNYRQQIAQALFNGIHAYASENDKPKG